MGSSVRKKKENAKDFKKQKLRVGKIKPKPDNFTNTSFKSKSIVIKEQSLRVSAPSDSSQFAHYLSVASKSRIDSQKREALSFLITQVSSLPTNQQQLPEIPILLPKLLPLVTDGSASVRSQVLKLFRLLPTGEIGHRIENILLYVRAGMTHLSTDIRQDALTFLDWLLEISDEEVVGCPGGWFKTLRCFMSLMGWIPATATSNWTFEPRSSFISIGKVYLRQIQVLTKFLKAGLFVSERMLEHALQRRNERISRNVKTFPVVDSHFHLIPRISNPYAYLNLFGKPRDEDDEAYRDRRTRQRVFQQKFISQVQTGLQRARKEGGEIGRAAALADEIVKNGMIDYIDTDNTG